MPLFHLKTNVPSSHVTPELLKSLSSTLAETSGKPEALCQVSVTAGVPMLFGGTDEPTAFGEYICIGGIDNERNEAALKKYCAVLENALKLDKDRFYLRFIDPKPSDIGLRGLSCETLFYPKK